ncbi:TPA: hypothetical protein MNM47_002388 [Raoultella ornithinolytica]|nr:hypothetical protein [Raoultella ornithinolytica]
MARCLPGLRLGSVRSPGQGFIPLSGNLPAGAVFTGVRWVSVRSPGQGVIPLSGNLPAGAMFTAVRLGPVRSPGKKGRFVARIRRCSIL